ncbi:MAG: glycosyltransferase family 39 protein [Bryobacteraceae bacterium]
MPISLPAPGPNRPFQRIAGAFFPVAAVLLLVFMGVLAGGAALRESVTFDETAHIGAGVSYLQKLDLRMNAEHPPLAKVVAALPLVIRGTRADYSNASWSVSREFFPGYMGQWAFGERLLTRWNDPASTLAWARLSMLLLTLALGWVVFACARRLGGDWAGLLCLSVYVASPVFLAFGPLVHTDLAVTLFSLLSLWTFADLRLDPSRKNVLLFALALAGALLSKFTAGILLVAFPAVALSTRWRAVPGQPAAKPEARAWRRLRWRATLKGILWAAVFVYAFYFIFSWNQPTDALDRLGQGPAWDPLRRLLMPAWLYLRGLLVVLMSSVRPTFILGHAYSHGVWFYFPVLLLLKSPLGFLGLLALALVVALNRKRGGQGNLPAIPEGLHVHWRVLWVSLVVFGAACLLSQLDISFRHFSVPLILLILLLAPLPRMLGRLRTSFPIAARLATALTVLLAASCLFTALRAYPYYFPYINAFSFGRPAYTLVNDSNVDWNASLPEVKRFAERHGLRKVNLDAYGMNDPTGIVPQAELWDCQKPAAADAGQWAVISANMFLDGHNCRWLTQYPHESLAGGSMYAIRLPAPIPAAGTSGGPPRPSEYRTLWGMPGGGDSRAMFQELIRHPENIPQAVAKMQAEWTRAQESKKRSSRNR